MMSNADRALIVAIWSMVGQIGDAKTKTRLEAALRDEPMPPPAPAPDTIKRMVLSGAEAAHVLGVTRRTVITLCNQGLLQRVVFPTRKRGFGYSRASVEALVAGRQGATGQGQG